MVPSLPETPEVSVTDTEGLGSGFTVIVVEVAEEQLLTFVTVTVYVEVTAGATEIVAVVAPLLQR
jgi:hypothetical protein